MTSLQRFLTKKKNAAFFDPAETLYRVGKKLLQVLLHGITKTPERGAKFADVASKMLKFVESAQKAGMVRMLQCGLVL